MRTLLIVIAATAGSVLSGCATLGLTSRYSSDGPTDISLINGPVAADFKDPKKASETLGRGKKMYSAGATVDANLITPAGRKLDFLAEAQRTHETPAAIEAGFSRIDKEGSPDRICFVASLTHQTIDLAKASAWKFKTSVDDGEWVTLQQVGRDDTPNYSVVGGVTEWFSVGSYCGSIKNWTAAKKSIRLNVFPPVFSNPGETILTWNLGPVVAKK